MSESGFWLPRGYLQKCSIPLSWYNSNNYTFLFETCVRFIFENTNNLYKMVKSLNLALHNMMKLLREDFKNKKPPNICKSLCTLHCSSSAAVNGPLLYSRLCTNDLSSFETNVPFLWKLDGLRPGVMQMFRECFLVTKS